MVKELNKKPDSSQLRELSAVRSRLTAQEQICREQQQEIAELKKRFTGDALGECESRYRTLFESIDEGVCLLERLPLDPDGLRDYRYLAMNPAMQEIFGIRDLSGRTIRDTFPDESEALCDDYDRVLDGGDPIRFERTLGRQRRVLEMFVTRLEDDSERRLLAVMQDVTARRRTETNLSFLAEVSQNLVQLTSIEETMNVLGEKIGKHFDVAQCTLSEVDEERQLVTVTHEWKRAASPGLQGVYRVSDFHTEDYRRASRIGETCVVRDAAHDARLNAGQMAAFSIGSFVSVPLVRDGEWRFNLSVSDSSPRDWRDDEIELLRELTVRIWTRLERARAEEALRVSEQKYRSLFENIDQGFCLLEVIFDDNDQAIDHRFIELNRLFEQESSLENALGKTVREIVPNIEPFWIDFIGRVGSIGGSAHVEHYAEPWEQWFDIHAYSVGDPDRHLVAVLFNNVTERKRAEEELRQLNTELERRVERRTAELTLRSEQLRQLASELTLAEQRERRRLAGLLHDNLQQLLVGAKFRLVPLERSADRTVKLAAGEAQELINRSIECSRSLTGELSPPILHQGGLGPALEWLAVWMQQKHGLNVQLDIGQDTEPESEDMRVLLFQSVRELLFNAAKHAGVKEVDVRLSKRDGHTEVTVSDQGAGFDPQEVARRAGKSGGFGLFSIRERLDLLGGGMEVDSAPGRGSHFTLRAPQDARRPLEPRETSTLIGARISRAGQAQAAVSNGVFSGERKIRVLLVDDHGVVRQGLSHLLGDEPDIEIVAEASDGQMAVEMVRRLLPDVVTMDINMPGMDGIDATRIIHAEFPEIRVIGMSMFEEEQSAEAVRKAGAVYYLTKSGPSKALVATIRACAAIEPPREESVDDDTAPA
jgi:PAS domain S-box-containing protein